MSLIPPESLEAVPPSERKLFRRLAVVAAAGGILLAAYLSRGYGLPRPATLAEFFDHWRNDPVLAPQLPFFYVVFVAVCAASIFPRAVVILAATAAFGPWLATALTSVGGTIGAGGAFLIARYVAQDFVLKRLPENWLNVQEKIAKRTFLAMFAFRAIPFSPMSSPHYAAGLTEMRLAPYLAGSFLGFIVSTVFYVFFSSVVVEAYKRFFDIPYAVPATIVVQGTFLLTAVILIRRKRRRDLAKEVAAGQAGPDSGE